MLDELGGQDCFRGFVGLAGRIPGYSITSQVMDG
ncbi:hypothetical protein B0G75_101902 [Paraburkholderia sp. BL18I3N2]|nr:hypothetical protein B0G75_101902 [Paraburkholderia sp. BL18I3N2]